MPWETALRSYQGTCDTKLITKVFSIINIKPISDYKFYKHYELTGSQHNRRFQGELVTELRVLLEEPIG